jgi:CubicO group peptidase (beta-lactamase class C family)
LSADGLDSLLRWPAGRHAAGWQRADGAKAAVGDMSQVFALASVTKLITATAVLVAVQEAIVDLDEPAGPPESTVRLLLCHASGLPFEGDGPVAPPGERRIYGNTGFEWLAAMVAQRAAMPFPKYVQTGVLDPLRMKSTNVNGSPATGSRSTLQDLLRFAGELLRPGRVIAPETLAEAITPQLPDLEGVLPGFGRQSPNPWGLGFELHGHKSPHWMPPDSSPATFGHFGQSGVFLWVDPEAGVACVALSELTFGDWAIDAWPELGSSVLAAAR